MCLNIPKDFIFSFTKIGCFQNVIFEIFIIPTNDIINVELPWRTTVCHFNMGRLCMQGKQRQVGMFGK